MLQILFDKNVFEFLIGFHRYSKAFKKVAALQEAFYNLEEVFDKTGGVLDVAGNVIHEVKDQASADKLNEIVRNSMAYAWEIGKGALMTQVLDASPENPFLNSDWADGVYG